MAHVGAREPVTLRVSFLISRGKYGVRSIFLNGSAPGRVRLANRVLRVCVGKIGILSMEHDPKSDPKQLVEVIPTFANVQSLRTHPSATCTRAGWSMDFRGAGGLYVAEIPRVRFGDREIVAGANAVVDASPERASLVDLQTDRVAYREC